MGLHSGIQHYPITNDAVRGNFGIATDRSELQALPAIMAELSSTNGDIGLIHDGHTSHLNGTAKGWHRLGRIEPRAVKRRPKAYPMLIKPRVEVGEIVRRKGHPKKLK